MNFYVYHPTRIPEGNYIPSDDDFFRARPRVLEPGQYSQVSERCFVNGDGRQVGLNNVGELVDTRAIVEVVDGGPDLPEACCKCDRPGNHLIHTAIDDPDEYQYFVACIRHAQKIIKWGRKRGMEMNHEEIGDREKAG